ncbi:MAG: cellulose biosynthesis protein CelD [Caulobacterales bacterium 68-7]|nr:GNAT family N-acetyltransferase [Caulobacterales bacterium]OJU11531.1 MAG: cellulose biosynthesis protein CelD [Caulobacterales bacterium 68-7]
MDIDVINPLDLPASAVARWSALQEQAPAYDSPFLSPHWARAVARAQAPELERQGAGTRVRVAVMSNGEGPQGFMSARVGAITAIPAGAPMCDYQGLVTAPDAEVDPRRLVQALGVARYDFTHMLSEQSAFSPHLRGAVDSWIIDARDGYEAWATQRKAAGVGIIKDLDKKGRKAERDLGAPEFTAFSRSRTDFDQLIAWKRGQLNATGQTDIFASSWVNRLVRDLFNSRDPDFGGVLFTLHYGGELAAAHFHLHGRHTIHGWLIAHNPAFEKHSPGLLLFQHILRWMDETPYSRLDLGAGDYRFKRELANTAQSVAHGFVGVPSPVTFLRQAAYGVRHAAERLPLGKVSEMPGKAMRRLDILRALR